VTTVPEPSASAGAESLDSGSYEVLRDRLVQAAGRLEEQARGLDARRRELFGSQELTVIGTERIRTENNCTPVDVVSLGDRLLIGYEVHLGLRQSLRPEEVLTLYRCAPTDDGWDLGEVDAAEACPGLYGAESFARDFRELVEYSRGSVLRHVRRGTRLLVVFQTGSARTDVRVFRWQVDPGGGLTYIDNRGERDYVYPPTHDFEWIETTREHHRGGRHPHVNIEDAVFVETVGGDLTIKIEDNTESGRGILSEPVEDRNQSLDDARVHYARIGTLIVLRVLPYREQTWRYFVYNTRAQTAERIDAIGQSCVSLPEGHGIIFPGGFYLQTGEWKVFDVDASDLEFKRMIRSPNGEDVLYAFHHRDLGHYSLFPYNLIRQEVANPIHCDGFTLFDDGRMIIMRHIDREPARVHPVQIWQTPFVSEEYAARHEVRDGSLLARVGNAELVRGISDCHGVARRVRNQEPTRQRYEDLIAALTRTLDGYHWLGHADAGGLRETLEGLRANAEQIVDEFEKVVAMRARAEEVVAGARAAQAELLRALDPERWQEVDRFMSTLAALQSQRGHLVGLREVRYVDLAALDALEAECVEAFDRVSRAAVDFLLDDRALAPVARRLDELLERIEAAPRVTDLRSLGERLDEVSEGLGVLSEVVATLEVDDPNARTAILEQISEVFSRQNRVRAIFTGRRQELARSEGQAEFAAQMRLLAQGVTSALAMADTPEECDAQQSRLMVQIEELESRFSELDDFVLELVAKRDEVHEAFATRKQQLLDARARRAQNLFAAGERILAGVGRRARAFKAEDELHGYFAADAMVRKLRELAADLLALGDPVKSDELVSRLRAAEQEALRGLRDRLDLFEAGAEVVRLGRHRFNFNSQPLELTIVPWQGGLAIHLTGTDFHEPLDDPELVAARRFWDQPLVSERDTVYRAEYLAAQLYFDAEAGREGLTFEALDLAALDEGGLLAVVRERAAARYAEGYERGLHDADAAAILGALLAMRKTAGALRFGPEPRAVACLFWTFFVDEDAAARWQIRARSAGGLRDRLAHGRGLEDLGAALARAMEAAFSSLEPASLPWSPAALGDAGRYLALELARERPVFVTSGEAEDLRARVAAKRPELEGDLAALGDDALGRLELALAWVDGVLAQPRPEGGLSEGAEDLARYRLEAAVLCASAGDAALRAPREVSRALTRTTAEGLLGQHPRIRERRMTVRLDELLGRLRRYLQEEVPAFVAYRALLGRLVERKRVELRVEEYVPRVLTSFVRNRLVNEVYLPLIGANLAKQLGTAGADTRTDRSGLLLLISPPGYGKTTLMEYVSSRLGLTFVKVNGPSLGHEVRSLDPSEAPNATARQEVDKINLALEMGNNVMLYLDDIQHTHPELLQKFISLCDAQRRIEGIWRGRTRTYDLRGKKFCVVMAGNPYTESGEVFRIPDMLANRADIYNLGDILEGRAEVFALSYIENCLTSSPTLSPLATRSQDDVYKLIRMARGEEIPTTDLAYGYSAAELSEVLAVFRLLFRVQEVLLAVNQQYIASASMDDAYRTEPEFKLQGSYRNMAKLAEKVVSAMNAEELEALIDDHYLGEAQTLTTGAEANLLKLRELRGRLTPAEAARWAEIKEEMARQRRLGGAEDDPVVRVTSQLDLLGQRLAGIQEAVTRAAADRGERAAVDPLERLAPLLERLGVALEAIRRPQLEVRVAAPEIPAVDELIRHQSTILEQAILPVARAAAQNLEQGTSLTRELIELVERLEQAGP